MMKKVVPFLFCIIGFYTLSAQITVDSIRTKMPLVNHQSVKALLAPPDVSFESIQNNHNWKPYDSTFATTKKVVVWLKFQLNNSTQDSIKTYIFSPGNHIDIYTQNALGYKHTKNGYLTPLGQRSNKREYYFTEIKLSPFQGYNCYLKLRDDYNKSRSYYPEIYSELNYLEKAYHNHKRSERSIGFIYFYLISVSCILIFVLVFWLRLQRKLYFYYLGYLCFQIIYGLLVLRTTPAAVGNLFLNAPHVSIYIFQPVQFIFIGFYILFILHLLEVKKYDKALSKVLYYFGLFCFAYATIRLFFNYFYRDIEASELLFTIVRLIVLPLNFVLIFWIIFKVKHPLLKYFIIGQIFFFVGAILSFYVAFTEKHFIPGNPFNFPYALNIIFQAGLLIEVFCFSIAIGENVFLLQKEKDNASKKLIKQLQQNRILQENMRLELDKKINQKTEELVQLYSKIERQKEEQIKKSFSGRLKEMEMLALRSQMNPHFIFNSLNALKYLVMMSRSNDAVAYLDDFSILLRSILQNSTKNIITVEEELEILELYLSLEKSRIGDSFDYNIQISAREELSQFTIPPLLLQPFVENAIWHGLSPSDKSEKRLIIRFDTTKNLKITIEDNGVGREASGKTEKLYNSMGTNITKERLSLYNHINDFKLHLNIIDLEDNGIAQGTRIILTYNY